MKYESSGVKAKSLPNKLKQYLIKTIIIFKIKFENNNKIKL